MTLYAWHVPAESTRQHNVKASTTEHLLKIYLHFSLINLDSDGDDEEAINVDSGDDQRHEDYDFNLEENEDKEHEKEEEHDKEKKEEEEKQEEEKQEGEKQEVAMKLMKRKIPNKTKLEKSIEVLSNGFLAAAEKEAETMITIEKMRHKERLEHEIRLRELDNERRWEERQHELLLLNLLSQNRNPVPSQDVNFGPPTMYNHYGTASQMQPTTSTTSQDGSFSTYYKL